MNAPASPEQPTTSDLDESAQQSDWRPWERLGELAEAGDAVGVENFLSRLGPNDQALALNRLDEEHYCAVLTLLPAEEAAEILRHLSETQAAELVDSLDASDAAAIVQEMTSDEQADLLGDLDDDQAESILQALPPEDAASVRELAAYSDDQAGGLLVREILRFNQKSLVHEVITTLSENAEEFRDYDVQYAYLTDDDEKLVGVLPMRNLLFAKRTDPVADIMILDPLSITASMPLEELRDFFDAHHFLGVPVVDDTHKLLGVVHRNAVDYESTRAAENDFLKSQGIIGGEELRTMPLWQRAKRRLSWLSINILLNIGAAGVIAVYQDTLSKVIALAVFLPIISDMSGCSGNQAVAVSMRELSLGLVRPTEMVRVWLKEISVGLINGSVLGLLVAIVAVVWDGNPYLGLVVGVALCANTLIAVSIGGTVPLLLKRLGFDPAVASGPLLTTVTDMCGFFLVLGLATAMLERLI
ncbi:magnesium transporter [Rhodopirellula baltica]|uniref:Magnesium transporter MgtE n=2 Tax=Rhodopirellula baltica TaxID=265606 RepID=F2AX04_RHOBT|nr:magnesium transporter [Rhodopirellula baltica]EGF25808.1 Divalent cation transporter [Rhodopirellula baltica WH47]ELP32541.1 Divalent cation transporter [Rhodopirellula baltica SWK14]